MMNLEKDKKKDPIKQNHLLHRARQRKCRKRSRWWEDIWNPYVSRPQQETKTSSHMSQQETTTSSHMSQQETTSSHMSQQETTTSHT